MITSKLTVTDVYRDDINLPVNLNAEAGPRQGASASELKMNVTVI